MTSMHATHVDLSTMGDALDLHTGNHVVAYRRNGPTITFGVTPGPVFELSADDADFVGRSLVAAAEAVRRHERGGQPSPHEYLATGCLHGDHSYCAGTRREDGGEKVPQTCKFCGAPCRCPCGHNPS